MGGMQCNLENIGEGCFACIFYFLIKFSQLFITFRFMFLLNEILLYSSPIISYYIYLVNFSMEIFIEIKLLLIKHTNFSTIFIIGFVCRDSIIFFQSLTSNKYLLKYYSNIRHLTSPYFKR